MATPTPAGTLGAKHTQAPLSTATPPSNAHLPSFSPAARSVPSPAAYRSQQADKSPFPTAASHAASVGSTATALNHPTGSSTGRGGGLGGLGGLLGSSPAGLDVATPAGHIATPAGLGGAALGGLAAADMSIGLSQMGISMGLGTSMGAGATDEDRRKRLEKVVQILGEKQGRVSDEAIERLAQRYGMAVQCDPPVGKGDRDGERQLAIAGETLLIEIQSQNNNIQTVSVQWPEQNEEEYAKSAADLLKRSLVQQGPGSSSITVTLDKFARNLERLSRLDRLEGSNFNCFEAISGVYTGLKRLYDHEKKAASMLAADNARSYQERVCRDVMCRRSGWPRLNHGERVGLSIEYWMDDHSVYSLSSRKQTPNAEEGTNTDVAVERSYGIIIDCEAHPSSLYPPVRTSTSWISDAVAKPVEAAGVLGEVIDWQDPPPTILHNVHEGPSPGTMMTDLGVDQKLPNIRFVARLDPPIAMPSQVAYYLLNAVNGVPSDAMEHFRPMSSTYDGLVITPGRLDDAAEQQAVANASVERRRESARNVLVPRIAADVEEQDGSSSVQAWRLHEQVLYTKPEFGVVLKSFPFSHPSQAVALLPMLRQYAFLNSLLRRGFSTGAAVEANPNGASSSTPGRLLNGHALSNGHGKPNRKPNGSSSTEERQTLLRLDLTLKVVPFTDATVNPSLVPPANPQLTVTFHDGSPAGAVSALDTRDKGDGVGVGGVTEKGRIDAALDAFLADDSDDERRDGSAAASSSAVGEGEGGPVVVVDGGADVAMADAPAEERDGKGGPDGSARWWKRKESAGPYTVAFEVGPNGHVNVTDQNIVVPKPPPRTASEVVEADVGEARAEQGLGAGGSADAAGLRVGGKGGVDGSGDGEGSDGKAEQRAMTDAVDGDPLAETARAAARMARMGRALEVAGDIGVWVEWLLRGSRRGTL